MLDLANNEFTEIPEVVKDIPGIPVLNLKQNRINASEEERSWLLLYRFDNDSLELFDWENSQRTHLNRNKGM